MNFIKSGFAIVVFTIASLTAFAQKNFTCTVKGTVIDRTSDSVFFRKITEDYRFTDRYAPIVDGKFEFKIDVEDIEAWDVTFLDEYNNGGWHSILFFPDAREVQMELYPMDQYLKNKVKGGRQNAEMARYNKEKGKLFNPTMARLDNERDSLTKLKLYLSPYFYRLMDAFDSVKTDMEKQELYKQQTAMFNEKKHLSPRGMEIENAYVEVMKQISDHKYEYIHKFPSIFGYSFIMQDALRLHYSDLDRKQFAEISQVFADKFPDHPYTGLVKNILNGLESIKVGGHFIDFTLPDLNGESHTLSELIKGKVAVIDLWATWCGPCIKNARELLPVYNEFKDKGFTIVGVAAEFKDTKALAKRLSIDKWPWVNLVELDHKNHIWDKYGASFGGGRTILVDQTGKVLAISPTAEEVRRKVEEMVR